METMLREGFTGVVYQCHEQLGVTGLDRLAIARRSLKDKIVTTVIGVMCGWCLAWLY